MLRPVVLAAAMLMMAVPARGGELTVQFSDGYVTVSAREVPVSQILQEWARQGNTRVVNAERIPGGLVTLELQRVPERQALEILLRSAAGYIAAPRTSPGGASTFASIRVMSPSSAPPPRQPVQRPPVMRPPVMPPVLLDDQDQPVPVDPNTGMPLTDVPEDPNAPEGELTNDGDPRSVVPQPSPYPGVQPFAPPGDPPPGQQPPQPSPGPDTGYPDDGEPPQQQQPVAPGPTPGQGTVVSPAPGQLPAPNPDQQPRR